MISPVRLGADYSTGVSLANHWSCVTDPTLSPNRESPLSGLMFAVWLGLAVVLGAYLPYLVGMLATPPGMAYIWTLYSPDDQAVYLAALRQGSEGHWLYQFQFSPEIIPPRVTYGLYLLAGRLLPMVGGSPLVLFHLLRLGALVVTVAVVVWWFRIVYPEDEALQRFGIVLTVFGGGLGWLAIYLLPQTQGFNPDLLTPEWSPWAVFLNTPHFIFSLAVHLGYFAVARRVGQGATWRQTLAGAALGLLLGLIYPYNIAVVGLVVGMYMLLLAGLARGIPWRQWLQGGVLLLPLVVLLWYFAVYARQDPNWEQTHVLGNVIPGPNLLGLLVGIGVPGGLAVIGLRAYLRRTGDWLVPVWAVVHLGCLLLPVPFVGRFALGVLLPVMTLAAAGWGWVVWPQLAERATALGYGALRVQRLVLIAICVPAALMVTLSQTTQLLNLRTYPFYVSTVTYAALHWLGDATDDASLILSDYAFSNHYPEVGSGRVYSGHLYLTVDLADKQAAVEAFWGWTPTQQADFLTRWGITHVVITELFRPLGELNAEWVGARLYNNGTIEIYKVNLP